MARAMMVWCGKAFGSAAMVESGPRVCSQNLMKSSICRVNICRGN
jgi:hypothetical protein